MYPIFHVASQCGWPQKTLYFQKVVETPRYFIIFSQVPAVKSNIERLQENPFTGKCLEKELSGYLSIRTKRFRIIYKISEDNRIVEIHHIGHRKDIYELFRESIAKH
jgi:mRNA-degrading endonuclease RelE of RelBE toxin-antitoxin system